MFGSNSAYASFSTDDLPAAWHFYKETLGLQVHPVGNNLNLTFPNGTHVMIYRKDGHVPASHTVLNIMVKDIDAAASRLREAGIQLEHVADSDDEGVSHSKRHGMPSIAWFKDPAGNWVSIVEVTEEDIA
jgi:catechol 2,3-dioxygenase-like lactoylglutathione lyase family enzyme